MKRLIGLIMICWVMSAMGAGITWHDVDTVLNRLDREIVVRDRYLTAKRRAIDSLKLDLKESADVKRKVATYERLGRNYTAYNNDSALFFFTEGRTMAAKSGLDSMAMAIDLRRISLMPLAGFYDVSRDMFEAIDTAALSPRMKALYYDTGRQMFNYIAAYFPEYPEVYREAMDRSNAMQVNLLANLPAGSPGYLLNLGEHLFQEREYARARSILSDLLERIPDTDNLYARAAYLMAAIARARGNNDEYLYYLGRSAIADIRGGTLEVSSLQELGKRMFELNNVGRAHDYLRVAHRNAVECGAILRVLESSRSMPLIETAHTIELNHSRRWLMVILIVMGVLLVVMVALLFDLRRKMVRLSQMKESLRSANRVKEIYISQFLSLCSIYMDKLNQFCKLAQRKISTGKVDDLYKLTKSGKFVDEQSSEFYEVFDSAFLHIYPTFISDVNNLLRPDSRIELREGEQLNTDLRILAFMRLGIEESTRIAQILNYSVYTIYTYRNKLKNRAVNRDTFEDDIMKIGAIE